MGKKSGKQWRGSGRQRAVEASETMLASASAAVAAASAMEAVSRASGHSSGARGSGHRERSPRREAPAHRAAAAAAAAAVAAAAAAPGAHGPSSGTASQFEGPGRRLTHMPLCMYWIAGVPGSCQRGQECPFHHAGPGYCPGSGSGPGEHPPWVVAPAPADTMYGRLSPDPVARIHALIDLAERAVPWFMDADREDGELDILAARVEALATAIRLDVRALVAQAEALAEHQQQSLRPGEHDLQELEDL